MQPYGQKPRRHTEAEAFQKLSALCAVAEYCKADIRRKLSKWEIGSTSSDDDDGQEDANWEQADNYRTQAEARIIARLEREGYIDENRYAHAFVRDKFCHNRWGQVRIAQELRRKGIAPGIISDALAQLPQADTQETLRRLLQQKRPYVKGKNDYEVKMKLIRFALSRGFEMDDILKAVDDMPGEKNLDITKYRNVEITK